MCPDTTEAVPSPPPAHVHRFTTDGTIRGSSVRNSAGEDFGDVYELILDITEGRITAVILSVGGRLGHRVGGKHFAIPWPAFSKRSAEDVLVIDVTREQIEEAPTFDTSWSSHIAQDYLDMIYHYYGYHSYWEMEK